MSVEIDVVSYCGHRSDVYPLRIRLCGEWIDVKVKRQWIKESREDRQRKYYFLVEDLNSREYLLSFDYREGKWSLMS